jgi:cell wall-associated NlpC family hydrolase
MATREQIVKEAREWVGTRFHRQSAIKRIGCDCGGLVRGVGMACGVFPADFMSRPESEIFRTYEHYVPSADLERACALVGTRIDFADAKPGDFVLMKFDGVARHVCILGNSANGGLTVIHAHAGLRKVVEHDLDKTWTARIMAAYVFPGVV